MSLRAGFHYKILVTPTAVSADVNELGSIAPERRGCRFGHESEGMDLFQVCLKRNGSDFLIAVFNDNRNSAGLLSKQL